MKNDVPDRGLVREYLLGRIDDKKELEELLSREICVNDDLSELVESIEEEIIDDFLDDTLDPADRDAVEMYFLRSRERKERLRFARLLRNHFERQQDFVDAPIHTSHSADAHFAAPKWNGSANLWRSHFETHWQLAALILVIVGGLIYIPGIRKNHANLEKQLAQERKHSTTFEKEAQQLQASIIPLTLVSDRSRGDGAQIPSLEINSSTQRILVEIALPGRSPGPFDVFLETQRQKEPIWTARLLPLVSASGDARLVFDIPVQGIASDAYSFVVSPLLPGSGRPKHYDFRVNLAK